MWLRQARQRVVVSQKYRGPSRTPLGPLGKELGVRSGPTILIGSPETAAGQRLVKPLSYRESESFFRRDAPS
jgi:hypothetical protein